MSYSHPSSKPDEELRLRDEHAFLERHLAEAIALAETSQWAGFENKWTTFMDALAAHVQYEEGLLFPDLAKSGTSEMHAAAQLTTEHQSIAKDVEVLDRESQQPDFFIEQLRYLLQRLRTHRQKEELILYPRLPSLHAAQPVASCRGARFAESDSTGAKPARLS